MPCMPLSIKQAAFLAAVLLTSALFVVYFQSTSNSVENTKDKVLSTFNILNSERYQHELQINNSARKNKNIQNNLNMKKHELESTTSTQIKPYSDSIQTRRDDPAARGTSSAKKYADEDWLLQALSSEKNKSSASYFEDSNLFGTYDFSSKTIANPNKKNKLHLQERIYFDYLALVLMRYQYIHNNLETVKTQQTWFDKKDEAGRSSLKQEAQDYIKISKELGKLHPPVTVSGLNGRIARAYALAGEKMLNLTKNMSTKELQNALLDYNQAAAQVTKALIAVSDYVSLLHIQFAEDEPGRIFVFPGNGKIQR